MVSAMLPAKPMEQDLARLRRVIAESEANGGLSESAPRLALGIGAIDAVLGGGLAPAALHEVAAAAPLHVGAATGFALALTARAIAQKQALFIATDFSCREGGGPYGLGLDQFGLSMRRLIVTRVARPLDALFAAEEALKCRALAAVIVELTSEPDLTATRRLALAAREGGTFGLLLRGKPGTAPSAAATRWTISGAPSVPDEFGGLGRTTFTLSLTRNRLGPCGRWTLVWDHHEHAFAALSLGVAETPRDRSDRSALVRAG